MVLLRHLEVHYESEKAAMPIIFHKFRRKASAATVCANILILDNVLVVEPVQPSAKHEPTIKIRLGSMSSTDSRFDAQYRWGDRKAFKMISCEELATVQADRRAGRLGVRMSWTDKLEASWR